MEYLSFIVSIASIIAALLAAYVSRKNIVKLEKKLSDYNKEKEAMEARFHKKSNEMHL
ncbi:hypothetical protein [Pantoea vagans]|uniref:hypothetical protein n=1 Tax=Pantoea vagans TaxID=470934 RepID=UPI0028AD5AA5|nr:hypothetical protein [Pantoea vagans]